MPLRNYTLSLSGSQIQLPLTYSSSLYWQKCNKRADRTRKEKHCCQIAKIQRTKLQISQYIGLLTKVCAYVYVHSRSISFLSWCLTQSGVGDWGQPVRQRCQFEQTEASRVNAGYSELLDLPHLYGQQSSSASKSLEYSIKNVLISTASSISNGSSLSLTNVATCL